MGIGDKHVLVHFLPARAPRLEEARGYPSHVVAPEHANQAALQDDRRWMPAAVEALASCVGHRNKRVPIQTTSSLTSFGNAPEQRPMIEAVEVADSDIVHVQEKQDGTDISSEKEADDEDDEAEKPDKDEEVCSPLRILGDRLQATGLNRHGDADEKTLPGAGAVTPCDHCPDCEIQ